MTTIIARVEYPTIKAKVDRPIIRAKVQQPRIVCRMSVGAPGPTTTLSALTALLNQYPVYTDDTAARLDGLQTHNLYWYGELTDTGIYDTLKRVSPL